MAAFLSAAVAIGAFAQTSRGSVGGTVLDASGAVVPGAAIELTNPATGVVRSTESNEVGIYRFDAVELGAYELKITMPGFKAFRSTGFGVEANRMTTLDARLEAGASDIFVEVNTETTDWLVKDAPLRGGNFSTHDVSSLPLAGLEPVELARTLPGVATPAGSTSFGPRVIVASESNSAYHAMQLRVDRRYARGFQLTGSYTFSRNIDGTGEVLRTNNNSGNLRRLPCRT